MPASLEGGIQFPDAYRDDVFWIWYQAGKPTAAALYNMIPEYEIAHRRPSRQALYLWIQNFKVRAEELDNAAMDEMKALAVKAKVEMLERHAKYAKEDLLEAGLRVLRDKIKSKEISANTAVRMVVEGFRIERESVGIPAMLDKLSTMDNDKLMETINDLVTKAPVEIEALDE